MSHTSLRQEKEKHSRLNIIIFSSTFLLQLTTHPFIIHAEAVPIVPLGTNTNTKVTTDNDRINITGGIKSGENLFHYFSQFNLNNDNNLYFITPQTIKNTISIINSKSKSKINGNIFSDTNLYLINKNGFILGDKLNIKIPDSIFIGTPDNISFPNYSGDIFDINSDVLPKISPSHLIFLDNSGEILVTGKGHNIVQPGNIFFPNIGTGRTPDGIRINDGSTISLGAGNVMFDGGKLTAPNGNINVYGIRSGEIFLGKDNNFKLKNQLSQLGSVTLDNRSLLDSSGQSSNTSIFAKNFKLTNESLVIHSNPSNFGNSNIRVFAKNAEIIGQNKFSDNELRFQLSRGIISQTFNGPGANILIHSSQVNVDKSGGIIASTFGSGKGGKVTFNADNLIVSGGSPFGLSEIGSQVLTTSARTGQAGNLEINSNLVVRNGGFVAAAAFGEGRAGKLSVVSTENIVLDGGIFNKEQNIFVPSSLTTATIAKGMGGDLRIEANDILVTGGARIDASSFAEGSAGSIDIDANSVTVKGKDTNTLTPSSIKSASDTLNPFLSRIFNLDLSPSGNAGSLNIDANKIVVEDGGELSVTSVGSGKSGDLKLNANLIRGTDSAILASTVNGNGGDITIDTNLLTLRESKVAANAGQGRGGNITITANAIFLTEDTSVTATSERGPQFDGSIAINQNNQISLLDIPFIDNTPAQLVLNACSSESSSINEYGLGKHFKTLEDKQLYAEDLRLRLAIAEQFVYTDTETGELVPFRRWLGIHRNDEGNLEMVFSPDQSKVLQDLLSFDISNCSNRS